MKLGWAISVVFALLTLYSTAHAQALSETTALLNNPAELQKLIAVDPGAARANAQVKALNLSDAGEQKVYQLSGKIFQSLSNQTGGDTEKLGQKIQDFLRDPGLLEKELNAEQKGEIQALSNLQK